MRIAPLALALLLATLAFPAIAPPASAVGTCTFATDPKCPPDAIACVGTSWSYPDPYYTCQYKVPWPCSYTHCVPW